jgi:hypothetical protein
MLRKGADTLRGGADELQSQSTSIGSGATEREKNFILSVYRAFSQ